MLGSLASGLRWWRYKSCEGGLGAEASLRCRERGGRCASMGSDSGAPWPSECRAPKKKELACRADQMLVLLHIRPMWPSFPVRLAFSTGCTGLSEKKAQRLWHGEPRSQHISCVSAGRNRIGMAGGQSHPSSSTFGAGGVVGSVRSESHTLPAAAH